MKKLAAHFLLLTFLFAAFVPQRAKAEFERLPALFEHFSAHRADDPSLSFFEFYKLHYGDGFAQHGGQHDHGQLPFKCDGHSHAPAVALAFFAPSESNFELCASAFLRAEKGQFPPVDPYFSVKTGDIWQPPRA